MTSSKYRAGSDIGGTFTDVIVFDPDGETIKITKVLSSVDLYSSVIDGLKGTSVALPEIDTLVHGSTIVINTLLERTGASTALITTEGFRDIYEMGRINRPDSFNLFFEKHTPLVERAMRLEVRERALPTGVIADLDPASLDAVAARIEELDVDALAVLLLHSYAHPENEQKVVDALGERFPDKFISASHEVSREYREFERTSTVAANAYVGPRVERYLGKLRESLDSEEFAGSLLLMQSNGGLYSYQEAQRNCIAMVESGPAGGVIGTQAVLEDLGIDTAVAFDMGGTTAKAGVIEGGVPRLAHEYFAGDYGTGLPIQTAVMDIREVGTGGGSIASVTEHGELRVGPHSAGSVPGPAAFARGGERATVTDANVVVGRLNPQVPLAGGMKLDADAARRALAEDIGDPLGMDPVTAAQGVIEIANTAMSYAISGVTIERGLDPAEFALVAYGGAGPLHATQLARKLGMETVVIPVSPGVFSAYGMLFADEQRHIAQTLIRTVDAGSIEEIRDTLLELEDVVRPAGGSQESIATFGADMRYIGQEHSVFVPIDRDHLDERDTDAIGHRFHELHDQLFSHSAPGEPVELVTLRAVHTEKTEKPRFLPVRDGRLDPDPVLRADVAGIEGEMLADTPFYRRTDFAAGAEIRGPAVLFEETTSTILLPGDRATIHANGHIIISIGV